MEGDRLAVERRRWLAAAGVVLALWLSVVAGAFLRRGAVVAARRAFVEAVGAIDLAIGPAGRPPRTPSSPAVDARFLPGLPLRSASRR